MDAALASLAGELAARQTELEDINAEMRRQCLKIRDDLATVVSGGSLGRRFIQSDARIALRRCVGGNYVDRGEVEGLNIDSAY